MAQMSTKEAKRRGLMPRSNNNSRGTSSMYGNNLNLNLMGRDPEPIMFGGLGRMNIMGNDREATQGLENLNTRGLYGLGTLGNTPQGLLNILVLAGAGMALTGNASFKNKNLKDVAMYGAGGYILYMALNN
ncbi:hypothetical protein N9N26_00845 [Candidatus Poseidoniales archaeon]|jgi:hypothetical protein|nr:hypothetical protein [Candidatus Poseidoniales archaeon]